MRNSFWLATGSNLVPGVVMVLVSLSHTWGWDFYGFTLWGLCVVAAQFLVGGALTLRAIRHSPAVGATGLLVGGWLGGMAATLWALAHAITTARDC